MELVADRLIAYMQSGSQVFMSEDGSILFSPPVKALKMTVFTQSHDNPYYREASDSMLVVENIALSAGTPERAAACLLKEAYDGR